MSLSQLRLTQFHSEKLRCIGGDSQVAPYRITTYRGAELGLLGSVSTVLAQQ